MNSQSTPWSLSGLPTEILINIFVFLPAKTLIKCRQVCLRWKLIIDEHGKSDSLWLSYCSCDYASIYKVAMLQSKPGLLWYDIYRSLSLWPKLLLANETRDEFAAASSLHEEIRDFQVLRNGVIGVQKRAKIVYYDIETLQEAKRGSIQGEYLKYVENDNTILILNYHLQLFIIRKFIYNAKFKTNTTFEGVKTFILVNNSVYFVTLRDDICYCNIDESELTNVNVGGSADAIMCLSNKDDCVYLLTFQRDIFKVHDKELIFVINLGMNCNLLHYLRQYNFLEELDWRIYFQWMYVLNHSIPEGPLRDIIVIRTYGDTIFVGSNFGVLRIYHAPYDDELEIFVSDPVKQYNFMERSDCPVLCTCPIIQINILESKDGHTLLVAMPKKIAVLDFSHNFEKTGSLAILPYNVGTIKEYR